MVTLFRLLQGPPSPNLTVQEGLPQSSPDEMFNWLKPKQQNKQHDNNNNKTNNLKYEPSAKTNNELACVENPLKNLAFFELRRSNWGWYKSSFARSGLQIGKHSKTGKRTTRRF